MNEPWNYEVRQFQIQIPALEEETRCRGCGYNTTDEERKFYGLRCGGIMYHYCTFCVEICTNFRKRLFFKSLDMKIHELKVRLRFTCLNERYFELMKHIHELERDHWNDVHAAPYKSDDEGKRIFNEHEARYQNLSEELAAIRNRPRHLYLEALEGFGGQADEPPCTRNLNVKQKKQLLRNLKEKLKECR